MTKNKTLKQNKKHKVLKCAATTVATCLSLLTLSSLAVSISGAAIKSKTINEFKTTQVYLQEFQEFEQFNLDKLKAGNITTDEYENNHKVFLEEENTIKLIKESSDDSAKNSLTETEDLRKFSIAGMAVSLSLGLLTIGGVKYFTRKENIFQRNYDESLEIKFEDELGL